MDKKLLCAKISKTVKSGYDNMTAEEKREFSAIRRKALTPEVRERIAQSVSRYLQANPKAIENLRVKGGRASRKYHSTKSLVEKRRRALAISKGVKREWASCSDEKKRLRVSNVMKGMSIRPTAPERALAEYLNKYFPNEWIYNGDYSHNVIIGTKVPDFVNINGKKFVLEVFGEHWHQESEIEPLKEHYRKFGFDCIIIWERDCYSPESLDKILREV